MAKIMLVEDDNNLREIYEARLAAEGYQIISAPDGEAALALAIKERPDLIISDIMMPKVSGFDMLDILRSTTETKNAKIIMMTALGQAEDKARAEKLGADRYLVKSQVTLEDVVKAAQEVLGEQNPPAVSGIPVEQPSAAPTPTAPTSTSLTADAPAVPTPPAPASPTPPVAPVAAPVPPAQPAAPAPTPITVTTPPEPTPVPAPAAPEPEPAPAPASPTPMPSVPTPAAEPIKPTIQNIPVTSAPDDSAASSTPDRQALTTPPSAAEETMATASQTLTPEDQPSGEQKTPKSDETPIEKPSAEEEAVVVAGQRKKVISPISDMKAGGPDLQALLAKEGETLDDEPVNQPLPPTPAQTPLPPPPPPAPTPLPTPVQDVTAPAPTPVAPVASPPAPNTGSAIPDTSTTAEEEAQLQQKIEQFITTQNPTISTSPINDVQPPATPTTTPPTTPPATT